MTNPLQLSPNVHKTHPTMVIVLILPLFIRGKLGISKIHCGTKFRRSHFCLHSPAGNRLWQLANCSALLRYAKIISAATKNDTGDKIKYSRISKNTETQQENTKENIRKTTEINWGWSKKIFWLVLVKTCEMLLHLISRFLKWG